MKKRNWSPIQSSQPLFRILVYTPIQKQIFVPKNSDDFDFVREGTDSKKTYSSTTNQATIDHGITDHATTDCVTTDHGLTEHATTDHVTTKQVASKHKNQRKVTKSTIKTRKEKRSKPVSKKMKLSIGVTKKGFSGR